MAAGAIAAEQRYGIPAAVTIAQAIDESGWGQSELATADHNLFGIKGTGPAGSDMRPTISAMEFPYSVAGLTAAHLKMRWPDIDDPDAPDKPGTRFRMPFGAVPVVLSLGYRAVA